MQVNSTAGPIEGLRIAVTRSAGPDGAVLVFIDTPFEPDGSDGGPGLRVHLNDDPIFEGVQYILDPMNQRPAHTVEVRVGLNEIDYVTPPAQIENTVWVDGVETPESNVRWLINGTLLVCEAHQKEAEELVLREDGHTTSKPQIGGNCELCSYDPHGGTKHRFYEEN